MGPLANFWAIVSVPDNIPIVFMLLLVGYFTYLSFDESRKNDRLIREGRKDQILRRMQECARQVYGATESCSVDSPAPAVLHLRSPSTPSPQRRYATRARPPRVSW